MNLFRTFSVAVFLFSTCVATAQQKTEIKWGEKQDPKNFISEIIGDDGTGVYAISLKEKKYFIEKYSSDNFKQVFSKKLVFPDHLAAKEEFESVFFIKKQIVIFSSLYDLKANKYLIYARKINALGDVEANETPAFEFSANRSTEHGNFEVRVSDDSTKFITYTKSASLIDGKRKIRAGIIDSDLKLIDQFEEYFEGENGFNYKEIDPRISVAGVIISKDQKVYMLINKYHFSREQSDFLFLGYDMASKNKILCPVELKDDKISSLVFSLNADGNLNVAGYYMERVMREKLKKHDYMIGSFFMKLDVFNNKTVALNKQDFEEKTFLAYLPKKKYEKGERLPVHFSPRKIIDMPDGSKILIAEYFRAGYNGGSDTYVPFTRTSTAQTSTLLYFNDILATNILPDGKISWTVIIPKNQTDELSEWTGTAGVLPFYLGPFPKVTESGNAIFYSFVCTQKDNKLFFIFNDNPDNLEKTEPLDSKTLTYANKGIAVVVTLDQNGKIKKKALDIAKDSDVNLKPRTALQTDATSFIIYGSKGGNTHFGRMIIK